MRNHMRSLTLTFLTLLICWGPTPSNADSKKLRVVTYGTSLTATGRWQRALQDELRRCWGPNVAVINKASNAKGSTWGLANVSTVVEAQPDIAIVEFAMNDARLTGGSSLDESRDQTKEIVAAIKSANPAAAVFLMTTPAVRGKRIATRPHLNDYYQMYRDLAASGVAGLIDSQPAWSGLPDSDIPDGVHPTPDAHRAVTVPAIVHALAPECR